jgi:type VI secretion system protein ImpL
MKRFLFSRWTLSFLGVVLLAALIWFLGPLIDALDSIIVRAAIIGVLVLIWALTNFLLDRKRRNADKALADGVAATSPADAQRAEEVAALREKLTTALALLRRASGARGYLYEQPWYVIIGPPGAGKTTALLNAGLKFPLAAEMGQAAVAGVGGTRMCDWWFTEQAVMIDTAGRYTTQDSDATVDRAGWEGFLDLLRRTRPRQPLNGVLVAIAAPDLAQATQAERLDHARAIRRRVKELNEKLSVRLPIYVLFTKLDLIGGFTEFFDDLDAERRGQIWGEVFDIKAGEGAAGPVAGWGAAVQGLLARLNDRVLARLQAERSPDKRALIAGFPAQFASLEAPLGEFLAEAFGGSRLDPAPLLRAVAFTSGTQEGTPIDRLSGVLARTFGLDQRRAPSLRPQKGRSYFLAGALAIVFGEAMLASAGVGAHRRRFAQRAGIFAAVGVATILIGGAMAFDAFHQQAEIARLEAALAPYEQSAGAQKLDPVSDGELSTVVPLLDQARALPYGYDAPPAGWHLPFGLSQEAKLTQAAHTLYRHALERVLLPRLVLRLEGQMHANFNNPDFLYQATRVYLMLGSQGPMDGDLIRAWEQQLDWNTAYADPALRDSLTKHLNALLAAPLPPVSLDGGLINDARSTFSKVPLADRVYSRIKLSAEAQAVPPWTPADAIGPSGVADFVRLSGKPLTDGIPGFFTVDGFHRVLLPRVLPTARQVAGESWVLGEKSELDPNSPALLTLRDDVIKRYETDYEHQWDAMIADLTVAPLGGSDHAAQALYVLSSPQSPLRDLLTGLTRQLTLSKPPADLAGDAASKAAAAAAGAAGSLSALVSHTPVQPAGHEVDEYYARLRNYVGTGPGAPVDLLLSTLGDMQKQVASLPPPGGGGSAAPAAGGGGNPAQMLKAQAATAPPLVARIASGLAGGTTALRGGTAHQTLVAAYNAPDGPAALCAAAVTGRYPFSPGATAEIPLDDFTRLFAPGGQFDSFFKAQLQPFVNTAGGRWTAQAVDGVAAPIAPSDLAQFQRAASIRGLFFAGGAGGPSVSFSLKPHDLDDAAQQATLTLGSTTVTASHSFTLSTRITWPGQAGMEIARLQFTPPGSGTGVLQAEGPWALFRLIDQGTLTRGATSDQYDVAFSTGGHHVSFALRAGSVQNPFSHSVLQSFSCPHIQ